MVERYSKYLKLFIFIMIIILTPSVFATEFNMNSYTSATLGGTKNRYKATEIDITGSSNTYTFGTQYNGRLSVIETYFDYPFVANLTYRLTYNMNTDDFRNNFAARYWWDCSQTMNATNQHLGQFTYVSYRKVQFTFTPTEDTTCIRVMIGSSNVSTGAITGVSNWRLNSITIYDPDFQSGGGSGQGSTSPTPTPVATPNATNQDIINNNNENTQDIINNSNENTQDIINNNNENTQSIINNNNENTTCPSGPLAINFDDYVEEKGKYLDSTGALQSSTSYGVSKYFLVKPDTEYKLKLMSSISSSVYYCLYRQNGNVIACYDLNSTDQTITTTSLTTYIRFTLRSGRIYYLTGPVCNDWEKDSINSINDSLTDDNVDSDTGSDFFDDFETTDPGGISTIVTKPLELVNMLLDYNNTCDGLSLDLPVSLGGVNVVLPSGCILWSRATPLVNNLWYIFVCGPGCYFILVDLFHLIERLKDPTDDEVDTIDL